MERRESVDQVSGAEALAVPEIQVLQVKLVALSNHIRETGIGRVFRLQDRRQNCELDDPSCVQIRRRAMRNPSICSLVAFVEHKHQKHTDQQMTSKSAENTEDDCPLEAMPKCVPDSR